MGYSTEPSSAFNGRRREIAGLSLLEVLIGLVLGGVVAVALYEFFASQQRSYFHQDEVAEMQQNLRVALERISRDLTMAGFGKPTWSTINGIDLSAWYNSANSYKPVKGGNELDIVGCQAVAEGTISSMELEAELAKITLSQPASAVEDGFNVSDRSDISIAGHENATVTKVDGKTLTVKPRPSRVYAPGTEVFVVRYVTYSTGVSGKVPTLFIDEHFGAHRQALCQFVTDLQVSVTSGAVAVKLTGRTRNPDRTTGRYHTSTMSTVVTLRNP